MSDCNSYQFDSGVVGGETGPSIEISFGGICNFFRSWLPSFSNSSLAPVSSINFSSDDSDSESESTDRSTRRASSFVITMQRGKV